MRKRTVWAKLLGVERTVIERLHFDEQEGIIVIAVRPRRGQRHRCGECGRRCRRYDQGEGRRRWRALDLGATPAYLEADAPRVQCPDHGVIVAAVPWARHEARHTRAFDDQAAWLATHCSKSAVSELLRVAWRTVGAIVTRVVADARAQSDPFAGLARIGIETVASNCTSGNGISRGDALPHTGSDARARRRLGSAREHPAVHVAPRVERTRCETA